LIHDGVELPRLLPLDRAAEVLGVDRETLDRLLRERKIQGVRVNGARHVLTESIADRLDQPTPTRHNQDR